MKNRNIFRLYVVISLCFLVYNIKAQNTFIQNKGQFPKQVKAKVNLPSGSLFIEQGKLTYAFYSGEQLAAVHDLQALNKQIDAHSFFAEFINSNADVTTELLDESRYHENYFVGEKSKWATGVKSYKSLYQKNIY